MLSLKKCHDLPRIEKLKLAGIRVVTMVIGMMHEIGDPMLVRLYGKDIASVVRSSKKVKVFVQKSFDVKSIAKEVKGARKMLISLNGTEGKLILEELHKMSITLEKQANPGVTVLWGVRAGGKKQMMVVAGW